TSRSRRGAGREAVDEALECRRDDRKLASVEGAPGRGHEPERAAALARAAGEPGQDELVERRPERDPGQLAAGGEDLLGDERVAAGALGNKQQCGRSRALALDLGHELGKVEAVERAELEAG